MRRTTIVIGFAVPILLIAAPALACGGLVAPNGAVQLLRTSTLAAYHEGVEHYITSFEFSGATGEFGSIVPLPAVPTKVQQGGRWTLQRLQLEVQPPVAFAAEDGVAASREAEVLIEKEIGALDIAVLKGGADEVVAWTKEHGFALSGDAPEVLSFYASRSPIFMAARFNAERATAQGLQAGDGTPIHLTIPTSRPWVPLHILSLGKPAEEVVEADIFLLTDEAPQILPAPKTGTPDDRGLVLVRQQEASESLLADLRSDRGMKWMPADGMTLTYLSLNVPAGELGYDLGLDAHGNPPSLTDVGTTIPSVEADGAPIGWFIVALVGALALVAGAQVRLSGRARTA